MVILIYAEKAFDEIQHLFMINPLNKPEIKETFLYLIKDSHEKLKFSNLSFKNKYLMVKY